MRGTWLKRYINNKPKPNHDCTNSNCTIAANHCGR